MKAHYLIAILIAGFTFTAAAQSPAETRPSPAVEMKGVIKGANVMIKYSAPSVKGRTIWGDLVPYGKVWRTGANEATTFESDLDLMIGEQKLPAGKYALFTIPGQTEWIWIFNSVWDQWGAYKYDESKDVLRIKSTPEASSVFHEQLKIDLVEDTFILNWENLKVRL